MGATGKTVGMPLSSILLPTRYGPSPHKTAEAGVKDANSTNVIMTHRVFTLYEQNGIFGLSVSRPFRTYTQLS